MNSVQIPREAVEAAEEAISLIPYDVDGDSLREAKAALNAAAPLLAAAVLDGVKAEIESLAAQRDAIGDDDYEADEDDGDCCGDAGECHRSGAMASYARVISLLERKVTELRALS